MYATKMLIAETATVPIAVLVNKDMLEMEQSVKVLSRLHHYPHVFGHFHEKTSTKK